MLEAKLHDEWIPSEKKVKISEKNEQEHKELKKNDTVNEFEEVFPIDHIDNNSKGTEAINSSSR